MKAITLIQPWATLIALGEKLNETRGWATWHEGELAIHAGKKIDREACIREPIRSTLAKHGYTADNLPTGAVIAICNLQRCSRVISVGEDSATLSEGEKVSGNEFHFGHYENGRFAWGLSDIKQLLEPIPAKGQQRLWNWNE